MRTFPVVAAVGLVLGVLTAQGSILPVQHLEAATVALFQEYTGKFEQQVVESFSGSGKFWIDDDHSSRRKDFEAGKPIVEARENHDIKNGSIHHFTGAIRVPGGKIEQMHRVLVDYANYPNYFRPDVVRGSGLVQSDSKPDDEHFISHIFLNESTAWMDVAYDAQYDIRNHRLDPSRWISRSISVSIKEVLDPKKPDAGFYPEGDDHGFLWRTNTYWFARERDGGLDLQVDSMTLSRLTPFGFGWWGSKRSHDAVDKMLRDTKTAMLGLK